MTTTAQSPSEPPPADWREGYRERAAARGIRAEPPGGPLPEPAGADAEIEDW
jgi:hypothetical protein